MARFPPRRECRKIKQRPLAAERTFDQQEAIGDSVCQDEVDQALPNARKNTRASKNSAIKPSAGFSEKTNHRARPAFPANGTWTNCKGTPLNKPHSSKWETTTAPFPASLANASRKK